MRRPWPALLVPFALSLSAALLCQLALGTSLGLFFGGVLFATILTPPLASAERDPIAQLVAAAATALGVAAAWSAAVFDDDGAVTRPQWLACSAALASYVSALWGMMVLLRALRFGPTLAPATVVILALAWLSWPVWLSPWYGDSAVNRLVAAHPLFSINGVFIRQSRPWGEMPLAYSTLMNLQDVPYELPRGVWWCVLLHGAIGLIFGGAGLIVGRRRAAAENPSSAGRQPAG